MPSESHDPPLRLTIEGLRWLGDEFESLGEAPAPFDLSTDTGRGADIIRLLRAEVAEHVKLAYLTAGIHLQAVDFDAPNQPTASDIDPILDRAERLVLCLKAFRQLAPEVVDDDDDEDDDEPSPDPGPVPTARAKEADHE